MYYIGMGACRARKYPYLCGKIKLDTDMTLSKIIKSAGMNLSQVAERMPGKDGAEGISRSAMQQMAAGSPRLESIRQISKIIGIPAGEIVRMLEEEGLPMVALVECGGRLWKACDTAQLRRIADEIDAMGSAGGE